MLKHFLVVSTTCSLAVWCFVITHWNVNYATLSLTVRSPFCLSGILAVSSVLFSKLGLNDKSEKSISRLVGLSDQVCHDSSLPNEVLYGRAGYLYSLLYVQSHLGKEKINSTVIDKVLGLAQPGKGCNYLVRKKSCGH